MPSRWDRLLDSKPVPLLDHLVDEAGRLLAVELRRWPLPVQEVEASAIASLGPLLEPDSPRPAEPVFAGALRLVQWDLAREHEAYDDYMRNRRYRESGITDRERPVLLFVSRWVLEQLLSLSDATEGRVDRPALLELVDRLERGLRASGRAAQP